MHAWEAIQKTLEYIEANISEEISIDALAAEAALSPFYYQRLFTKLVRKPVKEYVKLRRLARASEALQNRSRRIIDVALDNGFASHESFTRAFKEAYGITPEAYREHPVMLNHFAKPDLLLNYVMIDEGVPLISDGIVLRFDRRTQARPISFLGLSGCVPIPSQLPVGEATGVDVPGELWMRFHKEKHLISRAPDARELGVAYMGDAPKGSFTYFVGAEVTDGERCDGFTEWRLPAGEYVVCSFEAESFEQLVTVALDKALRYAGTWLQKHEVKPASFVPEMYYKRDNGGGEPAYMELWTPVEKG